MKLARRFGEAIRALDPWARARVVLYVVLALQAVKMSRMIPIDSIFDGHPLTDYNYSQMYADVANDRRFYPVSGRAWGFDPSVGAGQPVGAGLVEESHAVILVDRVLRRWFDPSVAIKLFVWGAFLLAAVLVFAAARLFGLSPAAVAVATAFSAAGSIGYDTLSHAFIGHGTIAFWLGAHVALFNAAALSAAVVRRHPRGLLWYGATLPFLPLLDPGLGFLQLIPIGLLLFEADADRRHGAFIATGVGAAALFFLNGFWMRPFLLFHQFANNDVEWPSRGVSGLMAAFFPLGREMTPTLWAAIRAYTMVFGFAELMSWNRGEIRPSRTLLAWSLVLGFIGFFGDSMGWFRQIEPGRFAFLFSLVLLLPASAYMASTFLVPGTLRIVFFLWFVWLAVSWQTVHRGSPAPLREALVAREKRLLKELRSLPRDRRVLVEFDPFINDMLRIEAPKTDHAFVGYATTWWNTVFARSGRFGLRARNLELFGEPLFSYEPEALAEALRRYNVGTVVITSRKAREFLEVIDVGLVPYRPFTEEDDYWIFKMPPAPSGYFLTGEGRFHASDNRLIIRPAKKGPIVLSVHYVDGMRAKPALPLRPLYLEGDPIPFISIDNAVGVDRIEVRYEPR